LSRVFEVVPVCDLSNKPGVGTHRPIVLAGVLPEILRGEKNRRQKNRGV
jgi:hypothetical protein